MGGGKITQHNLLIANHNNNNTIYCEENVDGVIIFILIHQHQDNIFLFQNQLIKNELTL